MEVAAEPKEEAAPTEVVAAEALTPLSAEVQQSPLDLWRMISSLGTTMRLGGLSASCRVNYRRKRVWMGVNVGALIPVKSGGVDPAYTASSFKQFWHITLFYSELAQQVWEETEQLGRIITACEKTGIQMVETWQRNGTHLEIDTFAAPHQLSQAHYAWSDIAPYQGVGRVTRITELLRNLTAQMLERVPFLKE